MGAIAGVFMLGYGLVFSAAKLAAVILFIACCLKYLRKDKDHERF